MGAGPDPNLSYTQGRERNRSPSERVAIHPVELCTGSVMRYLSGRGGDRVLLAGGGRTASRHSYRGRACRNLSRPYRRAGSTMLSEHQITTQAHDGPPEHRTRRRPRQHAHTHGMCPRPHHASELSPSSMAHQPALQHPPRSAQRRRGATSDVEVRASNRALLIAGGTMTSMQAG